MIRSLSWGIELFLGAIFLVSSQSFGEDPAVPNLRARALRPSDVNLSSCKEIGDSDSGIIGRLLWEQQDSIESEILNGLGGISLGTDLINKNLDTGYGNFKVGFDVVPKRRVYPVNFGVVRDGKPVEDPHNKGQAPKSGYYVIDTYRTALSAGLDTTRLLRNVAQIFNHVTLGESVEFGLQVRRIRLRRSKLEIVNLLEQTKEERSLEYNELNSAPPLDGTKSIIETGVEKGLGYIFEGVAIIYKGVQSLLQTLARPFTNDQTSQIFFAGLFDAVQLKQELFYINADTALGLVHGDILSMLQYITYGPNVGVSSGVFEAGLNIDQAYITREVRVTKLEGSKIRLSLVHYSGTGNKVEATMGIGVTHLKPMWGRANWENFFQTEIRYTLDLSRQQARDAFNIAAKQYKPDWHLLTKYSETPDATGVSLDVAAVIGDDLKDAKKLVKNGNEDGLKRSAERTVSATNVQLIAFRRKANGQKVAYKKCTTSFKDDGDIKSTDCNYNTLSQKTRTRTISIPKIIERHDAYKVGCESFASLATEQVSGPGVNLHCFYAVDDLLPTDRNYQEYLTAVKTMSGVLEPQLQPLYHDLQWSPAYYKIIDDLSAKNRVIHRQHQTLHIDLYMNQSYTDQLFRNPNADAEVQARIAQVLVGDKSEATPGEFLTWEELYQLGRSGKSTCHYNKNYVEAIEGAHPGNLISCNEIWARADEMWNTFRKISATHDIPKRLKIINSYYTSKNRRPYVPLMFLLLGGDYQNQVNKHNLALRFSYGAEDQKAEPIKNYDIGSVDGLSLGYVPLADINSDPNPGSARVFDVRVCVLPNTLKAGDPKIYLRFNSTLESTLPDSKGNSTAFQLSGFVNKHETNPAKHDTLEANFIVPTLEPIVYVKDGVKQYQYIIELSGLNEAHLKTNTNYSAYFNLEDRNIDYGDGEYEHFSELVKLLLNVKL